MKYKYFTLALMGVLLLSVAGCTNAALPSGNIQEVVIKGGEVIAPLESEKAQTNTLPNENETIAELPVVVTNNVAKILESTKGEFEKIENDSYEEYKGEINVVQGSVSKTSALAGTVTISSYNNEWLGHEIEFSSFFPNAELYEDIVSVLTPYLDAILEREVSDDEIADIKNTIQAGVASSDVGIYNGFDSFYITTFIDNDCYVVQLIPKGD